MGKQFEIGDIIAGQYHVDDIKRGGLGIVYLCHEDFDRRIALKTFILNSPSEWNHVLGGFVREAKIWISIGDAQNVVQAYHVVNVEADGQIIPHLALELIEGDPQYGPTLGAWIHNTIFDLKFTLLIAQHICMGMTEIQKKLARQNIEFVHRDLKPQNILLSSKGSVKITDFGLTKTLQDSSQFIRSLPTAEIGGDRYVRFGLTSNRICGTPGYMSPEQMTGGESLDVRSDIYSFGCILYEMCTRRLVFHAATVEELFKKHLTDTPITPAEFNPGLPKPLVSIIERCLAKNPDNRPRNFREIQDDLGKILEDLGHGKGLLFWTFGFSAYTDHPRAINLNRAAEAVCLEKMKGLEYVIKLGLVKDAAELESLKSNELGGTKEMRQKSNEKNKREMQAKEFVRMGDSLYALAEGAQAVDRVQLFREALGKYKDAQSRMPNEPQIAFRAGIIYSALAEVMQKSNKSYSKQFAILAIEEFNTILQSVFEPVFVAIGDAYWLLPYHALYFRAGVYWVKGDQPSAEKDFNSLIEWMGRIDNPKHVPLCKDIAQSTKHLLDNLRRT
ncbi:MAG: serine/threonine protein kinase [Proteobacteria bacterium]|nr:serine/threonine protein kinase [Pseudomonadota bacterium]